ncbi:WD40 repeat domain-containing protein [Kallotenue papyrolyticum]|uniref:WD40 repeat domain-containing protein n=1 Tax=Kallotenue papyrolyticum TaxID=1325125 RepID=UPI0004926E3C|nr:hypothetical protein [Kallotenue papyrolyticum]
MPRLSSAALRSRWQALLSDYVGALAWSSDGRWLAAAATGGPITIFDARSGATHVVLAGHAPGTGAIGWQPQAPLLASGGQDGQVRLWDVAAGVEQAARPGGAAWVERVAWSPTGDCLASAAGRVLRLWDAQGALLREERDHPSTIADLQWRPGGRELAVAVYGGVIIRHADAPQMVRRLTWQGSSLALAWSPTGRYIATGEQDLTVHFWDLVTERDLQMWGYETKVLQLAWDRTGRYLATGGGASVVLWDCADPGPEGRTPRLLKGLRAPVSALAYQPAGALLAAGDRSGELRLWPIGLDRSSSWRARLAGGITQLAWTPDGRRLAAGDEQGNVAVFDAP